MSRWETPSHCGRVGSPAIFDMKFSNVTEDSFHSAVLYIIMELVHDVSKNACYFDLVAMVMTPGVMTQMIQGF